MLARVRVVTRPAATIRRGFQLQRRFIHPSRSQFSALPRPNTWPAKIRFRADGKPRSKLISLGLGSLILFNLFLISILYDLAENKERIERRLLIMVFVQRTISTYDSVNFDDPTSNLSYFKKLFQCFTQSPEEAVDQAFNEFIQICRTKTKLGYTKSAEDEAYRIMRSTAEKIHGAFQEQFNQDSVLTTTKFVFSVMGEALESFVDLVDDGDNYHPKHTLKLKREKMDVGSSKDYEVLG